MRYRYKDRHKDTGTQRHVDIKTQGHKDTGTQRHRDTTQGHKDTAPLLAANRLQNVDISLTIFGNFALAALYIYYYCLGK